MKYSSKDLEKVANTNIEVEIKYEPRAIYDLLIEETEECFLADRLLERLEIYIQALEIIYNHKLLNYVLGNKKCANMYHLDEDELSILRKIVRVKEKENEN